MLDTAIRPTATETAAAAPPRRLGDYEGGRPGPTVVAIGGMHGNEPAGTVAIRVVLERLRTEGLPLAGRFVGLVGNRRALAVGSRFLDRDLNRRWSEAALDELAASAPGAAPEDLEQRELAAELAPLLASASEPVVFLDLHSTSASGAPFTCMADVLRNRRIAFALPLPVLLGIEEALDGTLMGFLTELGHVALAIEGGQSEERETAERLEVSIWLTLVASGALPAAALPDLEPRRRRLAAAAAALPAVVEVRHRHPVTPSDGFVMEPGHANFSSVEAGQVVARDRRGPVRAPESGLLLMPLYQVLGDDGFFVARRVSRFWLRLSTLLRRLRCDRLLPLLPGVERDPTRPEQLLVDRRVARFQTTNVLHLLGFRRVREGALRLVVSRRRPGYRGLAPLPAALARGRGPQ